jgi:alcohol dehydrogenase
MAVRRHGRVVLMGGVGMLGGDDLALPYPWLMRNGITVRGQWMFPREANAHLIRMACSGVLDLTGETVTVFPLERANDAVAHAAEHPGPFQRTVLLPGGGSREGGRFTADGAPTRRPRPLASS